MSAGAPATRSPASPALVWAGLITLYLVWGSTYLGIRVAVESIPPFLMGALRFIPAGIVLAGAIAIRNRATLRRPTFVELRDAAIVGSFLLLGGMGTVAWGEQSVPSGIAALMVALMPMWLAVFGRTVFGDRLPAIGWLGVVVGIVGVGILAWPVGGVATLDPAGMLALIASPILWSVGTLYSAKKAIWRAPVLFATALELIAGGLALLIAAAVTGELGGFTWTAISTNSWLSLGYLSVIGSLVGYATFGWLLTVAPLARLSTYAYVNPIVAVVLGAIVLGEPLSARTALAAAVIIAAVVLMVTARGRAARAPARAISVTPLSEV